MKKIVFPLLCALFFLAISCEKPSMNGKYVVNVEETKKNIKDEKQKATLDMILPNMMLFEIEIKDDTLIWHVSGMPQEPGDKIVNMEKGFLTTISPDNQPMKLRYEPGKIYLPDPIMGMEIVFVRQESGR